MNAVKLFLSLVFALVCATCLCSCLSDNDNDEDEGRKILSSKDYIITVASRKLEGVVTSCGNNVKTEVLAIKKDGSDVWESLGGISGFVFEDGYECKLKINETNYLDYRMGEPAWTEYKLIEILSKELKDTEGLPDNMIPEWFE